MTYIEKGIIVGKNINILNLYRKIMCSLLCIIKNTNNADLKDKALKYLNEFLTQYEFYYNKGKYSLNNCMEVINFCNECYDDKDVFDYAEDVEYGLKELMEIEKGSN